MKTIYLFPIIAFCSLIGFILYNLEQNQTDLEIYTPENIYYINGLTVTNENDGETLKFDNSAALKKFISDRTADDTQKCADNFNH